MLYGLAAFFARKAEWIALDAYNAVCSAGDRFFSIDPTPKIQVIGFVILAFPALAVRSGGGIKIIASFSCVLVTATLLLLLTATTTPQECVTMGGDYEDHASGLVEFVIFAALLIVIAYGVLAIDSTVWAIHGFRAKLKAAGAKGI
jgi:hypothetical protein